MLKVDHVTLRFGGLTALNDVCLEFEEGRIIGLIGPNGAGKTTFFNTISGVYKPDKGNIFFLDRKIDGLKPYQINSIGISRTYQVINLFKKMSVLDNVLVGMHPGLKSGFLTSIVHTPAQRVEEREAKEKALELLRFVGLESAAGNMAGELSYGAQRRLEIVRGLAGNPKLLLLDEPAAGMNSKEKDDLNILMKKIVQKGVTILVIEHDMKLVMDVTDYIFVLNYGAKLAEGTPKEIQNNPAVIEAYLGGDE